VQFMGYRPALGQRLHKTPAGVVFCAFCAGKALPQNIRGCRVLWNFHKTPASIFTGPATEGAALVD
jgi:hypothetical protein